MQLLLRRLQAPDLVNWSWLEEDPLEMSIKRKSQKSYWFCNYAICDSCTLFVLGICNKYESYANFKFELWFVLPFRFIVGIWEFDRCEFPFEAQLSSSLVVVTCLCKHHECCCCFAILRTKTWLDLVEHLILGSLHAHLELLLVVWLRKLADVASTSLMLFIV